VVNMASVIIGLQLTYVVGSKATRKWY